MHIARLPLVLISTLALAPLSCRAAEPATSDLAQEVRSILSNRCFACHGPDEAERQAGLRLDDRQAMLREADSGLRPIEPGNVEASELFRRLVTDDESERMPPEDFGKRLSEQEIELVRQWIERDAPLPQHWSFVPPQPPALPQPAGPLNEVAAGWLQHPVDLFVLSQQQAHGLLPSPPATRAELLRRLSLDLTGLPPTPEEVKHFEADEHPEAYERQVDRLLASPAYGEHWARKWLDLARYADSAGYADDPARTIWAYRDWVIDALNENKTIDQFTIEQIAGDLLPQPTQQQLVATAFHRNTLTNNEGGTNDEEFRNVAVVDRVNTTLAVWMGVTMACAQCHTHKYDPFTQAEYFQLFAIFNQSQDADRRDESPVIELFTADQLIDQDNWRQRIAQLEQQLSSPSQAVREQLVDWESTLREPVWQPLRPMEFQSNSKSDADFAEDHTIRVRPVGNNIVSDNFTLEFDIPAGTPPIQAIALRTVPNPDLPGGGAGLAGGNFVVTGVTGTLVPEVSDGRPAKYVRVELPGDAKILSLAEVQVFADDQNVALQGTAQQSSTDYAGDAQRAIDGNTSGDYAADNSTTHTAQGANPWWELQLSQPARIDRIVLWNRTDNNLHTRLDGAVVQVLDEARQPIFSQTLKQAPKQSQLLAVVPRQAIPWVAAYADYAQTGFPASAVTDGDKSTGWAVAGQIAQSHLLTLVPKQPLELKGPAKLVLEIQHNSSHRHHLLGSFRGEVSCDASAAEWSMLSPELRAIASLPSPQRTPAQQAELLNFFSRFRAPATAAARTEIEELQRRIAALKPETSVPIMRDMEPKQHRQTFVQVRGNYKSLGQQVEAGTPAVFHPVALHRPAADTPDRLDLARWLVDDRNPLTARVWVNRSWESLFGLGIVRSSEEFGAQGDMPTHPRLLDWLACELMREGWDQKMLLRTLVTSQTYRQTSKVSHELLEADKDNVWLARGPRVRLSAEMIRDQALAAAGLLCHKMYGPPVRPPQPTMGLTAAFGSQTDWQTSQGEDRYRRGLYTTWRRSNPYPSMATFDAPSREVCTLRRDSTNTPLQALVTLNDPAFVEAAQALARRVVLGTPDASDDPQRITAAFEICTSRAPHPQEIAALAELLSEARRQLSARPEEALKLATDPLGDLPAGADAVELAAWTSVANILLNLDEVLMKR